MSEFPHCVYDIAGIDPTLTTNTLLKKLKHNFSAINTLQRMRSVFCFPRTLDFALGFYVFLIELIHTKAHSHRNTNTDAHSTKVTIDLSRMLHGQVPSCTFSWRSPVKQRSRASRCVLTRCALEKGMDVLVMGTNIKQVSLNYETPPTNHTRKQTMAFHGWNTWVVARSIESGTSRKN